MVSRQTNFGERSEPAPDRGSKLQSAGGGGGRHKVTFRHWFRDSLPRTRADPRRIGGTSAAEMTEKRPPASATQGVRENPPWTFLKVRVGRTAPPGRGLILTCQGLGLGLGLGVRVRLRVRVRVSNLNPIPNPYPNPKPNPNCGVSTSEHAFITRLCRRVMCFTNLLTIEERVRSKLEIGSFVCACTLSFGV